MNILTILLVHIGNPFAVDTLFCDKNCFMSHSWQDLRQLRRRVLSKRTIVQYLSYIEKQLKKHEKKAMAGKRIYHTIRLLYEAKRIIQGQDPNVFWPVSDGPARTSFASIHITVT